MSEHNNVELLPLADIRTDGGTQIRDVIDSNTVAEYAEAMADDAIFPPLTVFHDEAAYWLADGFHRVQAAQHNGTLALAADVRHGTQRDARLYAAGANATHGMRRSNADKRKAVMSLFEDAEWSTRADREIARHCGVSHTFVQNIRQGHTGNVASMDDRTFVHPKTGQPTTMQTGNIGKRQTSVSDADVADASEPPETSIPQGADDSQSLEPNPTRDEMDSIDNEQAARIGGVGGVVQATAEALPQGDGHLTKRPQPSPAQAPPQPSAQAGTRGRLVKSKTIEEWLEKRYPEAHDRPTPAQWLLANIVDELWAGLSVSGQSARLLGPTLSVVQEIAAQLPQCYTEEIKGMVEGCRDDDDEESAQEYEQLLDAEPATTAAPEALPQLWAQFDDDTRMDFLLAIGVRTPQQDPRRSAKARLLEAIEHASAKSISVAHIATLTDLDPKKVSQLVFRLKGQGQVAEVGRGIYSMGKGGDA